jgi:alpha-tubulin suppressor-like RCC1 family protein
VWGANSFGQLGDWAGGPISPKSSPVQVGTLTDWSTVQAGDFHSVGTKTDGTLWTWGLNDSGQLGLGVVTNRSSPVQLGTLATWNKSSAGVSFTMAIKTDGTLWGWGLNTGGQLGLDAIGNFNKSSPVQVGTSISWHSVSIDEVQSILIKRYQ